MKPKFYLTTPLYAIDPEPDLSHVYTTVIADAIARYKRLSGFTVCALTGTKDHVGPRIVRAAMERGLEPHGLADQLSISFGDTWSRLGLGFDEVVRATEARHAAAVAEIARRIGDSGFFYRGESSGGHCAHCEIEVPQGADDCPECGRSVGPVTGEGLFFRLSALQEKLLQFYESNPDFVLPQARMSEVLSFVKGGLSDIRASRSSDGWGSPVPDEPAQRFSAWFDALTGYLSGIGFASDDKAFASRWPADVQVIGRDMLRTHAVYWPALLIAAGLEPPRRILVNGLWNVDGERMSESRGNLLSARALTAKLPADCVKYFLMREIPVGGDGDFTWEALVARVNAELANDVGNLANRTLKMIQNYFDSRIPEAGELEGKDEALIRFSRETVDLYRENFDRLQIHKALDNVRELISAANRYVSAAEPWMLARDVARRGRLGGVLYNAAETVRILALLLSPVVPDGSGIILRQLGIDTPPDNLGLDSLRWGGLRPDTRIGQVEIVYRRLDLGAFSGLSLPDSTAPAGKPSADEGERISIEDFTRIDMRVGRIVAAERIAKSAKLVKLRVDLGSEERQVVAGIGGAYDPETLPGRMVVVVTNLKPVTLMGVESNGMIVAASDEGTPVLATFSESVSLGARLR
jgi:methionyl-tRNA synthetase